MEDFALINWCRKQKRIPDAEESWWSLLARDKNIMIRHPKVFGNAWHLPAGTIAGSCIQVIPMQSKIVSGITCHFPCKLKNEILHFPVVDPEEVQCQYFVWHSPLWFRLHSGRWLDKPFVAFPVGDPQSLLKNAANHCFYDLPLTALKKVAKAMSYNVPPICNANVVAYAVALSDCVIGPLTFETKISLARMRDPVVDEANLMLCSEEAQEYLDVDDQEAVKKTAAQFKHGVSKHVRDTIQDYKKEQKADYEKKVADHAAKVAAGGGEAPSSSAGEAALPPPPPEGPPLKKQRRYAEKIQVDPNQDGSSLDEFLPTDCRLFRDNCDGNWRLSSPWGGSPSRAWRLHGFEGAARLLIQLAWQKAIYLGYEDSCPFDELEIKFD